MKNPWVWVPTLFVAEEIPTAMVTFVAPLMFLQTGVSPVWVTLFSSLLFIPWIIKPRLQCLANEKGIRGGLYWTEVFLLTALLLVTYSVFYSSVALFLSLLSVSLFCVLHKILSERLYVSRLDLFSQRYFHTPRSLLASISRVLTYGVLIITVGWLQIHFRQIRMAWSVGCLILVGVFSLFFVYHLFQRKIFLGNIKQPEVNHTERRKANLLQYIGWFLLFLPQGLMFFSRVLFLLDKPENGGLGCTIQEVGFAQGTVGVIAFSMGLAFGKRLLKGNRSSVHHLLGLCLGISPCAYLLLTLLPSVSLPVLCLATFMAQLLFGLGLNLCNLPFFPSSEDVTQTTNPFYIPLVLGVMILPMAISGWMVQLLGYHLFFLVNTLSVLFGWIFWLSCGRRLKRVVLLSILLMPLSAHAARYSKEDSCRVVSLLEQGKSQPKGTNMMMYYARQFVNVPYTSSTLEHDETEQLSVNLHQMDCMTFVETVAALTLSSQDEAPSWEGFCTWLTKLRYDGGVIDGYASRNHYFSQWVQSNEKMGLVEEIGPVSSGDNGPFTQAREIDLHYMSAHPAKYPVLQHDREMADRIRVKEKQASNIDARYIPCSLLDRDSVELGVVQDGDILAIVTKVDGLDVSHLGLAEWGKDGKLHLLNASSVHHKVVLESMPLQQYMTKHPSQLGVRVIRVCKRKQN